LRDRVRFESYRIGLRGRDFRGFRLRGYLTGSGGSFGTLFETAFVEARRILLYSPQLQQQPQM
jgi:hypothetical protein